MWKYLIAVFIIVEVLCVLYLISRIRKFKFIKSIAKKNAFFGWMIPAVIAASPLLFLFINVYAAAIALLHLALIWVISDLIALIWRKTAKRKRRKYVSGFVAVAVTVIYLGVGWFCAHHVFRVDYSFTTDKALPNGNLRIIEIADLHLGITLDGDDFAAQVKRMNADRPDVAVICGDFVDDDTLKEDMIIACEALGELDTTYGVYFIYGNHDEGYFDYRDFTSAELVENLEKNGVTILKDESVLIDGSFYLIGRKDRTFRERVTAQSLTKDLDQSRYSVMLDHQPNDYAAEAESGADLVLSGHTHGGHIFPAGPIGIWMGANDRFYGTETRGDTTFLVTSGISGWGIPFKTGCISEYVVIDITSTSDQ